MDSPIHRLVAFCISAWIALFVLHRFVMLREGWQKQYKLWGDDKFVSEEICQNITLRANLGFQYENICHEATVGANVWPLTRALKHVIQHTHLCGDVSCLDIVDRFLDMLSRSMAWTLACVVLVLLFVVVLLVYVNTRRLHHKHKYDVETCRVAISDESYEPYYNKAPPTPSKRKQL